MLRLISSLIIIFSVSLVSCKQEKKSSASISESTIKAESKYKLTAFKPSTEYGDATINSYSYKEGKFSFDVSGTNYELGQQTPDAGQKMCANSGKGQHIHLIVDNLPYAAKYVSDFEHKVENGEHNLLAFLSRSYHESIKSPSARVMQKVRTSEGSIVDQKEIKEPIIFYSRPKGTYVGTDTKKVMLDFYLGNMTLTDGFKVEVDINGDKQTVDKWQPYYIENMPMGENTITLTVLDKDGNKAKVLQNPVSRTFTLKEDLTEG